MALVIEFDRSITREAPIEMGPFETVELRHRRISADGRRIALRKTSGIWAIGNGFLELHIRPEHAEVGLTLVFADPWRDGEVRVAAQGMRLVGDRLWIADSTDWIATDQDDDRCWVMETSGDAFDRLLAA
jgi:hypothetical protein